MFLKRHGTYKQGILGWEGIFGITFSFESSTQEKLNHTLNLLSPVDWPCFSLAVDTIPCLGARNGDIKLQQQDVLDIFFTRLEPVSGNESCMSLSEKCCFSPSSAPIQQQQSCTWDRLEPHFLSDLISCIFSWTFIVSAFTSISIRNIKIRPQGVKLSGQLELRI